MRNPMDHYWEELKAIRFSPEEQENSWKLIEEFVKNHPVRVEAKTRLNAHMDQPDSAVTPFLHEAGKVRLLPPEQKKSWKHIDAFVQVHPIRTGMFARCTRVADRLEEHLQAVMGKSSLAFSCFFLFGITGFTAIAAESSLPGDFLYDVKTEVMEEVIDTVLDITPHTQTRWNLERINRRMDEAVALLSEEKMEETALTEITEHLIEHATDLQDNVEELSEQDTPENGADIQITLEASLGAHARRVEQMTGGTESARTRRNIVKLSQILEKMQKAALQERMVLEQAILASDPEEVQEALEENMSEATENILHAEHALSAQEENSEATPEAVSAMDAATLFLDRANENLQRGQKAEALHNAHEASRLAQEADFFMEELEE